MWRLVKDCVGMTDLQSLPLPVDMLEPYTEGMKGGEHVLYADLLDKVDDADCPKCYIILKYGVSLSIVHSVSLCPRI